MTVVVVVTAAVLVAAGLVAARRRWTVALVRGGSMSPTFADGERVLAERRRAYRVGEVVVFRPRLAYRHPGDPRWRIKRVAAVAGDPLPDWLAGPGFPPAVPPGHLVVSGDNPRSQDSRQLGFIATAAVAGRVVRQLPG